LTDAGPRGPTSASAGEHSLQELDPTEAPGTRVDLLARIERGIIVCLFAMLTVLGVIQVVNRYVLRLPVWNIEQFLPHIFIVITFIGLSQTFRTRSNLAVTLLPDALPPAARRYYDLLLWVLSIVFLAGLGYMAAGVVAFQSSIGAKTNMGYPASWLTAVVVLGCALAILRIIQTEILPLLRRDRAP
jgi:TRAP-type C4-dicarboxylate transport system permease small subunit